GPELKAVGAGSPGPGGAPSRLHGTRGRYLGRPAVRIMSVSSRSSRVATRTVPPLSSFRGASMRSTLAVALALALLTTPALAHGGQYKGPSHAGGASRAAAGQAAPPPTPGGATAPGPGAPASGAAPTGPVSGGGRGKGNGNNATGGPVIDESTNYEIWEFWWENNKDQYLNLKNRLT